MKPANVHKTISKNMLADGNSIVFDMERSHGVYFVDEVSGREYLDFYTFIASNAIAYNHPKLKDPAFLEKLTLSAVHKPANSDIYTTLMAEFVQKFNQAAKEAKESGKAMELGKVEFEKFNFTEIEYDTFCFGYYRSRTFFIGEYSHFSYNSRRGDALPFHPGQQSATTSSLPKNGPVCGVFTVSVNIFLPGIFFFRTYTNGPEKKETSRR